MKSIKQVINESLNEGFVFEGTVDSADDFRDFAYKKLKSVFGDEYDEDIADKSIEDLIDDKKDDEDWGVVIGRLTANMGGE